MEKKILAKEERRESLLKQKIEQKEIRDITYDQRRQQFREQVKERKDIISKTPLKQKPSLGGAGGSNPQILGSESQNHFERQYSSTQFSDIYHQPLPTTDGGASENRKSLLLTPEYKVQLYSNEQPSQVIKEQSAGFEDEVDTQMSHGDQKAMNLMFKSKSSNRVGDENEYQLLMH